MNLEVNAFDIHSRISRALSEGRDRVADLLRDGLALLRGVAAVHVAVTVAPQVAAEHGVASASTPELG